MDDTRRITISTAQEAIRRAKEIFANEPDVKWIIATGDCTVAGVFFDGEYGDLVMHRAVVGGWTQGNTEEHTKQRILEHICTTAGSVQKPNDLVRGATA